MTLKRTGVPAPPPTIANGEGQATGDMVAWMRAIMQNLTRLEALITANTASLDKCTKWFEGNVPEITRQTVVQPNPANGDIQFLVNNGAFTLNPPTENCKLTVLIQNGPSAGSITTSSFTKVTGTAPGTTTQYLFVARITVVKGKSWLEWQALQ